MLPQAKITLNYFDDQVTLYCRITAFFATYEENYSEKLYNSILFVIFFESVIVMIDHNSSRSS